MSEATIQVGQAGQLRPMLHADGGVRSLVLVCPGGGYLTCTDNEGVPVAQRFNELGFHAAVLTYSTLSTNPEGCVYPVPQQELACALAEIRRHAKEWQVDPDAIAITGFSAGGHLCAQYAATWQDSCFDVAGTAAERRPNAAILGYPLLDTVGIFAELQAEIESTPEDALSGVTKLLSTGAKTLLGAWPPDEELSRRVSPIVQANADVPPTFIWTIAADSMLDPRQSAMYACRLMELGVPCELHIFAGGFHGISLATEATAKDDRGLDERIAQWPALAASWLRRVLV